MELIRIWGHMSNWGHKPKQACDPTTSSPLKRVFTTNILIKKILYYSPPDMSDIS